MLAARRAFDAGPVQQAVRVEGVPHMLALAESEADGRAALRDARRFSANCSRPMPYLAIRYSAASAPSGPIVGFSSKGWKCSSTLDVVANLLQRALEGRQADGTPWAGHVGDEVDLAVGHRLPRQLRVEQVAQAVAQQVQAQHRQRDRHAGEDRQQRRLEQHASAPR